MDANGFVPIQNYTTLKQQILYRTLEIALYPYKITLLSNNGFKYNSCVSALYPYKITLLSNRDHFFNAGLSALYPYKITLLSNIKYLRKTAYEPFV